MIRRLTVAVAFVLVATHASAQPSAVAKNREIVLGWYRDVLTKGDAGKAPAYLRVDYVEHAAQIQSGLAGFQRWAAARNLGRNPLKREVLHTVAEGDFVAVFSHAGGPADQDIGYMDFYRLVDGKLAEHWGFEQAAPDPTRSLNTNGFITTPPPINASAVGKDEARNREGALGWFYEVLAKGDTDRSSTFQQDSYIQHAAGVATGNKGFREWAKRRDLPNNPLKITIVKTVAEGDYVVTLGVATMRGDQVVMPDWIRMRDGKLQEHWGLGQTMPAADQLGHGNGFIGGLAPVR